MRWLFRGLGVMLVLAVLALGGVWLHGQRSLPVTEGTLKMAGLEADVAIERDEHGIPTVRAASLRDAVYGLGVVHAQDRLWQLEMHRRIGAGRLAEAFGENALETDRFLRALAVRRAAQAQWELASPQTRQLLEAYSQGINAVVRDHVRARPPEFVVLGLQPADWAPVDSLAWAIMMAWDLGANWSLELQRMRLALQFPVARVEQLLPPYPGDAPLLTTDYAELFRSLKVDPSLGRQALLHAPESGIEGVGSNNWVVSGTHSSTGKPLLASDPHLKLSAPALWYFVRLEAPGLKVAGATMPGLPLVVMGQNEHVAWGFTNTGPDVQDVYLERIKPDDATQYQTPDGWAAFETEEDLIRVKGRPDVKITVRRTRHGPVISDAGTAATAGLTGAADKPAYALALRWTALDPDPGTLDAGMGMAMATSVDSFIAATASYVAPMQNMAVADRDGRIGVVSAGRVPVRKPENELKGLVPSPGWDARYDWAGWVPAGETPREVDPPRGWIATANQRIHGPDYPHFLTSQWASPYRMERITQMLEARPKHDMASLRQMQADVVSLGSRKLLPYLRDASSNHPLAAQALQRLAGFDGTMAADRPEPLIFWAWSRQVTQGIFADDLGGPLYERTLGERTPVGTSLRDALLGVLERNDASWCDDRGTPGPETCAEQSGAALGRALDELQAVHGSDLSRWQWGAAHQMRSEHRPFSRVKLLAPFFELRQPTGGDTYTVNVSRVGMRPDATTGELYLNEHGPSLRGLYDLADPSQSRVMHSTGQSGNPFSAQYGSFAEPWARVEYVPLWAVGPPKQTLTLAPAGR